MKLGNPTRVELCMLTFLSLQDIIFPHWIQKGKAFCLRVDSRLYFYFYAKHEHEERMRRRMTFSVFIRFLFSRRSLPVSTTTTTWQSLILCYTILHRLYNNQLPSVSFFFHWWRWRVFCEIWKHELPVVSLKNHDSLISCKHSNSYPLTLCCQLFCQKIFSNYWIKQEHSQKALGDE